MGPVPGLGGAVTRRREPSVVELSTPTWDSGPLLLARSSRARRIGLGPAPGPFGLLMRCTSIHTVGMGAPIGVVAVGVSGAVVAARVVPPGRLFRSREATWIAETAVGVGLPVVGDRAELRPILAGWPAR